MEVHGSQPPPPAASYSAAAVSGEAAAAAVTAAATVNLVWDAATVSSAAIAASAAAVAAAVDGEAEVEVAAALSNGLSPAALALAAAVAAVISVVTVVGNLLVLVAFKLEKQLQTASNCMLLSLAVADVGLGLISIPLHATYWIMGSWPLGSVACHVWLCFDYSFTNASVAHLLLICLDRFLSVHSPLTYLSRRTRRRALVVSILAWAIPFSIWTPLVLAGADGATAEPGKCRVELLHASKVASVITCMLEFFIPMAVILALYFKIYLIVRRRNSEKQSLHESGSVGMLGARLLSRKSHDGSAGSNGGSAVSNGGCPGLSNGLGGNGSGGGGGGGGGQRQSNGCLSDYSTLPLSDAAPMAVGSQSPASRCDSDDYSSGSMFKSIIVSIRTSVVFRSRSPSDRSDAKAARTLSVILLAFLITWTPYEVFTVIIGFAGHQVIPSIIYETGFALVYLNSTINPICYALGNVNFRRAFLRILKCKYWKRRNRRSLSLRSQRPVGSLSFTEETISPLPIRFKSSGIGFFSASVRRTRRRPSSAAAPAVKRTPSTACSPLRESQCDGAS